MSAAGLLDPKERERIALTGCADPVYFCTFFLPHLFPPDKLVDGTSVPSMPWPHRGILAILTKQTQFLLRYGELGKIVDNFTYKTELGEVKQIFEVWVDGELWPADRLKAERLPFTNQVEIRMSLGRFTLIEMPRGFSKTTLVGIAIPLYNILYEVCEFTLYVSESSTHAKMQMDSVKRELSGNERIQAVFGDMKPKLSDDQKWSQELFETKTGMKMAAKGRGGQIRGTNYGGKRPDIIICDDLEDRESVESDTQRMKVRTWAYGDLMPALDELDEQSSIVALGTLLHKEALLQVWAKDPTWNVVKLRAHDLDGDPIWARMMDDAKYQAKKKSFAMSGMLHIFYMEYDNEYRAPEIQLFKEQHLHILIPESPVVVTALYLDPAISEDPDADHSFLVCASRLENGMIRVRDHWYKVGAHPREQVDMFFTFAKIYEPQKLGIETNAFQRALAHLVKEEMARWNLYFEVTKVTHSTKKDYRIRGIVAPRWAADYITLDKPMPELVTQLLDYPAGRDDGPDALAGAIALLDESAGLALDERDPYVKEFDGPLYPEHHIGWVH